MYTLVSLVAPLDVTNLVANIPLTSSLSLDPHALGQLPHSRVVWSLGGMMVNLLPVSVKRQIFLPPTLITTFLLVPSPDFILLMVLSSSAATIHPTL